MVLEAQGLLGGMAQPPRAVSPANRHARIRSTLPMHLTHTRNIRVRTSP